MLKNAYVCEADLLVNNPKLIRKYEYTSNYLGVYKDYTDDWCFLTKRNRIAELAVGGTTVIICMAFRIGMHRMGETCPGI